MSKQIFQGYILLPCEHHPTLYTSVSQFVNHIGTYVSIFRTRMSQKTLVKRKFRLLVFSMGIVNSTMIMGFPMGIVRIAMILVFPWELLVTNRDGTYKSLEPKF